MTLYKETHTQCVCVCMCCSGLTALCKSYSHLELVFSIYVHPEEVRHAVKLTWLVCLD